MSGSFDVQEVLAFAIDLAHKAGKMIVEGSEKRFKEQDAGRSDYEDIIKKNTADLVTETDQNTEKLVIYEISKKFPTHKFIGEESTSAAGQETKLGNEPTWIVDPIDGTTNFTRGLPMCCISIGVAYQQRPVIGVVFAPFSGDLYYGSEGHGSWLQTTSHPEKRKLPLSMPLPLPSLKQAVIAVEWGSDRKAETIAKKTKSFARLAGDPDAGVEGGQMVSGIRSLGSAALSCCAVAQGSIDLWQEVGCWSWDVCAGIVIAQEAGGVAVGSKQAALSSLSSDDFGKVTREVLQGRKYLVVRKIGGYKGETGKDAQKRIIKSFYDAIEDWDAV